MKKTLLLLGILVAANILFAQEEKIRERAEVKIEEYKERLNLSEEQLEQIKELKEKYKPEYKAIAEDESMNRSDKMRARADLFDKREAEMETILDEEQMTELKVIRKEVKANIKERRERRKARKKG